MRTKEFEGFGKIARWSRPWIITEKIDGTNGQVFIGSDGEFLVGSRTRWITPADDNQGFAAWCYAHKDELVAGLGVGRHFGEWWGGGIQRGYGLEKGDKRFSLFNVTRWCLYGREAQEIPTQDPRVKKMQSPLPECVGLVPVLVNAGYDISMDVDRALAILRKEGSRAVAGYMNPEGVVIYHTAGNVSFKATLDRTVGKWADR